jgi:RNA polymerase sigma-70 factor (ECF subfamily)
LAGRDGAPEAREAMETLCRVYWKPLYVYARRLGQSESDAKDLTQGFFEQFLENDRVRSADPQRGRFRSFLLSSFRNFMAHAWVKRRADKRGGAHMFVPWEERTAGEELEVELAAGLTPERHFDKEWALKLFAQAFRLLGSEFAAAGKAEQFEHLKTFLSEPASEGAYAEAARQTGLSKGAVTVAVHRLRQRYREVVRAEVARTVSHAEEIEEELRYLIEVMSG